MNLFDQFFAVVTQIQARLGIFLGVFFVAITITFSILYVIDFLPEPPTESEATASSVAIAASEEDVAAVELDPEPETEEVVFTGDAKPNRIIIDALDKTIPVLNPTSRTIEDLDEALLSGVVRHPDSADFSADGNMFILGHSSYLPNVLNRNFQAFNGLQDLTWGDRIRVQSADTEYIYRVERVYQAKASEVVVPHTPGEAQLTLATCNSFGSIDDRYMVEAVLIDTKSL